MAFNNILHDFVTSYRHGHLNWLHPRFSFYVYNSFALFLNASYTVYQYLYQFTLQLFLSANNTLRVCKILLTLYCILPSYKMEMGCVKTIIQIQLFYHTVRNHFIEDMIEREGFFRLYIIFCSCRNVSLVRQATFRDKKSYYLLNMTQNNIFLFWILNRKWTLK